MSTIDYSQLCKILECFTSQDNNLRQNAEAGFNTYKETHFEELLIGLLRIMKEHQDPELRTQAITSIRSMFRTYLTGKSSSEWDRLSPQTKIMLRSYLLHIFENDTDSRVKNSVCVTISVFGGRLASTGDWPELNPKLISMIESDNADAQERALKVLAELVPYVSTVIQKNITGLHRMISVCAKSPSFSVRYQALCFVSAVVLSEPKKIWKKFQDSIPDFLEGLSISGNVSMDYPEDYLSAFVVIADVDASFFKPYMSNMLDVLTAYASTNDEELKQMIVEVLLSIAENKPLMCLKIPNFVMKVVNMLMELMLTVEHDINWIVGDDNESSIEETRNYDVGESGLDRLTAALGGENVMNVIFHFVSIYLRKEEWHYKLVAIMAISQTAEYLPEDELDNHLKEITHMLLTQLKHSHHYVRFAACQAIGQIATDHQPYFQNTYAAEVLPALIATVDDQSLKVQSHAISALINFNEEVNKSDLLPYADALMQMLFERIGPDKNLKLREQSLTCLAVVAGVLEKNFLKYYNIVMPATKEILLTATKEEEYGLRGRAVECASIIGFSVGKEAFEMDGHDVIKCLLEMSAQGIDADEVVDEYMSDAFRRICRTMKESFVPYVQHLMPKLLKSLMITSNSSPELSEENEDMTLASIAKGDCSGLKTSAIQDMIHSLDLLFTLFEVLSVHMKDYILQVAQTLLPLLKMRLNETVKRPLFDCIAELLKVSKALELDSNVLRSWVTEIAEQVFNNLRSNEQNIINEANLDLLVTEASGLATCLCNAGGNVLTDNQVTLISNQTFMHMKESNQRRAQIAIQKQDPDYDEEDIIRLEEDECYEQNFRSTLLEIIAAIMKTSPQQFMQYCAPLCQEFITTFIHQNCTKDDRALALYVCDDVLEHLKDNGAPLWPCFAERLIEMVLDKEPGVRQAAAYGIIQAAHCTQFPVELIQRAASNLVVVLNEPISNKGLHASSRDNVVAAIGALVLYHGINLGPKAEEYLGYWINNLPLKVDEEEGRRTHKECIDLMLKGNPQVLGPNNANVPKLVAFCASIYKTEFSTAEIDKGIRTFVENIGFDVVRQLGAVFSKKLQQGLDRIHSDFLLEKNNML